MDAGQRISHLPGVAGRARRLSPSAAVIAVDLRRHSAAAWSPERLVRQAAQFGVTEPRSISIWIASGRFKELITTVDMRDYLPLKRRTMAAHAARSPRTRSSWRCHLRPSPRAGATSGSSAAEHPRDPGSRPLRGPRLNPSPHGCLSLLFAGPGQPHGCLSRCVAAW